MKFKKPYEWAKNKIIEFKEDDKNYVSYNVNAFMNEKWEETALKYNWKWYIVNWDLRKECEKCKNIDEIIKVFKDTKLSFSWWSTDNINNI